MRRTRHTIGSALALTALLLAACSSAPKADPPPPPAAPAFAAPECEERIVEVPDPEAERLQHSASQRMQLLERLHAMQWERYRELSQGLESLESRLGRGISRAEAVTYVAEAQISLRRARESTAGGGSTRPDPAQQVLALAESHLDKGNIGAAVFFAYRAKQLSQPSPPAPPAGSDIFRVAATRANLREFPVLGSRIVAVLDQKTPIYKTEQFGGWILGYTPDWEAGWISTSVLKTEIPSATER